MTQILSEVLLTTRLNNRPKWDHSIITKCSQLAITDGAKVKKLSR